MSDFDKTVLSKVNKELRILFEAISEQYKDLVKQLFEVTEREYCEETESFCTKQSEAMHAALDSYLSRMNFDIGQELAAEEMAELMQDNRKQNTTNETTN